MEILVNREPLDFNLEEESSVGEVIDGLADWLNTGRYAITSLDVNATTYAIHDRTSWQDIALDDVRQLAVEALPLTDVNHATIIALDEYCSILAECLEERNGQSLPELAEELPYVQQRLKQFFPSLAALDGTVSLLADPDLQDGRMPSQEAIPTLLGEIDNIRMILRGREREYRQPATELAVSLGQLSATAETLIEVPVQLQTGKEQAAMQTIIGLTELLTKVVRLIPLVERTDSADEIDIAGTRRFAEELAPFLAELKEAFEIQDTVLVGDLLEYEIAPRLEQLDDLLPGGTTEQ